LQNSENSGILRDFSTSDKNRKNGKRLSVTFLHFFAPTEKGHGSKLGNKNGKNLARIAGIHNYELTRRRRVGEAQREL